ncbi:hypothetical protein IM043_gp151 [Bacillus phage SPG24]|nr:hypothetical protein IM043_gp151 [Bacillus phage SPG24]
MKTVEPFSRLKAVEPGACKSSPLHARLYYSHLVEGAAGEFSLF